MLKFKKAEKTTQYKKKISKSVQDTLPYIRAYDDGILEIKQGYFSKTIGFQDINYQISRQEVQESIFLNYCSLLNSFEIGRAHV